MTSKNESFYPIMEHFATLQGEGFHSGKPAYFIRTGGCDVGCHWCDVKESWPGQGHAKMHVDELLAHVNQSLQQMVVVTGGEPTMLNLEPITNAFRIHGKTLHLETSGAYPVSGTWDWITFSPKKFKAPLQEIYLQAHELKVVIFHESDFKFAEQHAGKVGNDCLLYLQPEWSKRDKMMPLIVDYIKQNPKWRISLQTHKYLNIP